MVSRGAGDYLERRASKTEAEPGGVEGAHPKKKIVLIFDTIIFIFLIVELISFY